MKEYRSHAYSVSSCKYHFVRCSEYHHSLLGVVEGDVREGFGETADYFGHDILPLELADDLVHLFVRIAPSTVLPISPNNLSHLRQAPV